MKPLLSVRITRERKSGGDWVPAADQATDAGRDDFWARQQKRIAEAAKVKVNVTPLTRRKA